MDIGVMIRTHNFRARQRKESAGDMRANRPRVTLPPLLDVAPLLRLLPQPASGRCGPESSAIRARRRRVLFSLAPRTAWPSPDIPALSFSFFIVPIPQWTPSREAFALQTWESCSILLTQAVRARGAPRSKTKAKPVTFLMRTEWLKMIAERRLLLSEQF
jgi:hypothetical protein